MRRLTLVALVVCGGCRFDPSFPPGSAPVPCGPKGECPTGFVCVPGRKVCQSDSRGGDVVPPVLTGRLDVSVLKPGASAVLEVLSDKPLDGPPTITTIAPGSPHPATLIATDGGQQFVFGYASATDDPEGLVRFLAEAVDVSGNIVQGVPLAALAIDGTAPEPTFWTATPGRVRPGDSISVSVTLSEAGHGAVLSVRDAMTGLEVNRIAADGSGQSLGFLVRVLAATPSTRWSLSVDGVTDLAGNVAPPFDVAVVDIDADPPVVGALGLTGHRFSAQPGFNHLVVPLNLTDAVTVHVCLNDECRDSSGVTSEDFTITPLQPEGVALVSVTALDAVGNSTVRGEAVTLDFTPPSLLNPALRYLPPPECPRAVVAGLTTDGGAQLSFLVNEALGALPQPDGGPGLAFSVVDMAGTSYTFDARLKNLSGELSVPVSATLTDDVGNSSVVTLPSVQVDTVPPPALTSTQQDGFVYLRQPWGSVSGARSFTVQAAVATFDPGTFVSIWSGNSRQNSLLLASGTARSDGSVGPWVLPTQDLPQLYYAAFDSACNVAGSVSASVPTVSWVASLKGKVAGQPLPNPHRFVEVPSALATSDQETARREFDTELGSPDLVRARSQGGGSRWEALETPRLPLLNACLGADPVTQELLLWGRKSPAEPDQGWRLSSNGWRMTSAGPQVTTQGGLAKCTYDAAHRRLVASTATTTWLFDGQAWNSLPGPLGGGPLVGVAYDSVQHRVLAAVASTSGVKGRSFDGATWTSIASVVAPPNRSDTQVAFDPTSGALVMFGGFTSTGTALTDVWALDATGWHDVTPVAAGPSARKQAAFALEPQSGKLLLVGGKTYVGGLLADAWFYDPSGWVAATPLAAPVALLAGLIDPMTGKYSVITSTLQRQDYVSGAWVTQSDVQRTGYPPAPVSVFPAQVVFWPDADAGFMIQSRDAGLASYEFDGVTWQTKALGLPGAANAAVAYDPAAGAPLLFGGDQTNFTTWKWGSLGWSMLAVPKPLARVDMAVATDVVSKQVWIAGGQGLSGVLKDAWLWDGSGWKLMNNTAPPRTGASMAYFPPLRGELLFGGYDGTALAQDTWAFDGGTWVAVARGLSPPARRGAGLVWDARRGVMVMHGGTATVPLRDTWELMTDDAGLPLQWVDVTPVVGLPAASGPTWWDPAFNAVLMQSDTDFLALLDEGRLTQRFVLDTDSIAKPDQAPVVSARVRIDTSAPVVELWNGWTWVQHQVVDAGWPEVQLTAAEFDLTAPTGKVQLQLSAPGSGLVETDYVEAEVRYHVP